MVQDAKRWMRDEVLARHRLLPPIMHQVARYSLWEALPPVPSSVLSYGGVMVSSTDRQTRRAMSQVTGMSRGGNASKETRMSTMSMMDVDTWPGLADVVVVEREDIMACRGRGHTCIAFPGAEEELDEDE